MTQDDKNIAVLEAISEEPRNLEESNPTAFIDPVNLDNPLTENQKKQIAFNALRQTGLCISKAGKLAGYESKHVYRLDKKRRAVQIETLAPLAKRALRNTLKGDATGNAEKPKTSDVISASKMIFDRTNPVVQRVDNRSVSVHMELTEDERKHYLDVLGLE